MGLSFASWFVITLDPIVSFYGLVFVSLFLAHLDFNILSIISHQDLRDLISHNYLISCYWLLVYLFVSQQNFFFSYSFFTNLLSNLQEYRETESLIWWIWKYTLYFHALIYITFFLLLVTLDLSPTVAEQYLIFCL